MDIGSYNSYLTIDLKKIKTNIRKIREQIGTDCSIMPVIKGNAYGFGTTEISSYLVKECDIKIIANSQVYEAIELRDSGIKSELLVLGGIPYHNIKDAVSRNIQMPLYSKEFAKIVDNEAKRQNKIVNLHIKIETGLNRIGVKPGRKLKELVECIRELSNINIKGAYTHLVESEVKDKSFSYEQLNKFKEALDQLEKLQIKPDYIHVCNSAAATWFEEAYFNLVRPAGAILGFDPNVDTKNKLGLESSITWKAFITNIKEIDEGEAIGYNRKFIANKRMKVATLSFGYGDGYAYPLAFKGAELILKGKRVSIIGICMDQTFADISEVEDAAINDEVTIIGKNGEEEIDIFELSNIIDQPYTYLLSIISQRVKRIYI